MKKILFALTLQGIAAVAAAEDEFVASGFAKVDFRSEIPVAKLDRLLAVSDSRLFVARQDGAIDVLDKSGKSLLTLPAKIGKDALLKQPEAIAIYGDTVYVVDSKTEQVVMYGLGDGKVQGSFGSKEAGMEGGLALGEPHGIAVHEGVVYVADTDNERIQMFGINGVFLGTLKLPIPADAAADKKSMYAVEEPADIAIDYKGRIYVLDEDDQLINAYDLNGKYLRTLPKVAKPVAMKVAEDGIYVADAATLSVSKYDFDGNLAYTFGSKGQGKAQFMSLNGLAVDRAQQIYVGDAKKSVVNAFVGEAGKAIEPLPKAAGRTSVQWVQDIAAEVWQIAWDGRETFYAIANDRKGLKIIRKGVLAGDIQLGDVQLSALTIDKAGAIWVLDKKNRRGIKLDETGKELMSFGGAGSGAGQFNDPAAIAVSSSGMIFVADRSNKNVQIFRADGVYLSALNGDASKSMNSPNSLTFDSAGNLYVLDAARNSFYVYSPQGKVLGEFGKEALAKPISLIAIDEEILVLDEQQIKVFSSKGALLRSFGSKGSGNGNFNAPVDIAYGGGAKFVIADRGNKRVQMLATLHKPAAPQQLVAEGKVHSAELRWNQSASPYIKHYRIYRSKSEQDGFVQVGSAQSNQFVDQGLQPDVRYYYRIAAETHYGFEGATSAGANAMPVKFVPQPLAAVQAETTSWQVKLHWVPVEPTFFAAYRIYVDGEKEGEFKKVGEVVQPEFVQDGLVPEATYTYYLTVLSTDGTESAKTPVVVVTQVFNRPPLEIEVVQLRDVFSNSYKIYERDGIGSIKLTNNTNKPMQQIKVTFQLKDFMDFPTESKIGRLQPGESEELVLKAVFNNSILTLTEDSPVQAMIEATYFEGGKREVYNKNMTVNIYDKHRLTWDERNRFATFITPKDGPIVDLVRAAVGQFKETKDETLLAAAVFDMLGTYGLTYIQDPSNPYQVTSGKAQTVDYIQFPRETLERKSGDCDDLVALYSAALESMGVSTRVLEVPGHMLMMFSTGIPASEDGYTMDNMYVIHEGVLWIPVETTLLGSAFIKAWEKGASTYYKWKDSGLTMLNIQGAWEIFKPASLPVSTHKRSEITRAEIDKKFPGDYMSVLKISSQTKTRNYLNAIRQNPADVEALMQMGIILAKAGDRAEAMKYFDKVLSLEPKNAAALNNRGNLHMIQDNYPEAIKAYAAASRIASNDAQILVNLARAYKSNKDIKNAKAAFSKAIKLDSKIKNEHRALALELQGTL